MNRLVVGLDKVLRITLLDKHFNTCKVYRILSMYSSSIFPLKRMTSVCSIEALNSFHALTHSHISYGIILYGATLDNNFIKIQKCQKEVLRIIAGYKS